MTKQKQTEERWIATDLDERGNPRRYEIVHQEEAPLTLDNDTGAPIVSPVPVQPARSTSHVEGGWSDRARAFNLSTMTLSLVTGGLFVVASIALNGAVLPMLALTLWFFTGFAVTWLVAYVLYVFVSSEGSQFMETWFLWQFLRREQAERHRRYGAPPTRRDEIRQMGDRVFAGFIVIWLLVGFVFWLIARGGL